MKAWQVRGWGEPEEMTLADTPIPDPGPGEIRIANRAMALNFFDILQIQGKYQVKPPFPFTPGAEVAGVVDAVGSGVTGFAVGDRVLSAPMTGAFAEYTIAPVGCSFPIPEGMDFPEAAALPVVYHTSYFALERRAALQAGEWLLVHAGASGTGMAAIQIGKALGARSSRRREARTSSNSAGSWGRSSRSGTKIPPGWTGSRKSRAGGARTSSTIRWAGIFSISLQNASRRKGGCWWLASPVGAFQRFR